MSETKTIARFPAGVVRLPPSKSLSHRAVICAALAAAQGGGATAKCGGGLPPMPKSKDGTPAATPHSSLHNLGDSQDIRATMACAQKLYGVRFAQRAQGGQMEVYAAAPATGALLREGTSAAGTQGSAPKAPGPAGGNVLDCAESGSTLRFFIPLAAMAGQPWRFCGRGRLMQRPQGVYHDVFAQAGAQFEHEKDEILVHGPLPAGAYRLRGDVSSQFFTGLLLALPLAAGDSRLVLTSGLESAAYVDLTLDVMRAFGVAAGRDADGNYAIPGGQRYRAADYHVEGDWSQAAFFLGAGALGCPVACAGLAEDSRQGDAAVRDILTRMGARVTNENGLWRAGASRLEAVDIDAREIPDLVPPLAALCCFAVGQSSITGAARLRLKESDRLAALAGQLRRLGAYIRETEDGLVIRGQKNLPGGAASAMGDHRIAMALALAAIGCTGPVSVTGWQSVEKSYPAFWRDFEQEARHGE